MDRSSEYSYTLFILNSGFFLTLVRVAISRHELNTPELWPFHVQTQHFHDLW